MAGWLYIMASRPNETLYVGVTNDLVRRVHGHRECEAAGFTSRYRVKRLVYYEQHETMPLAIQREKALKHWSRQWKLDLITGMNPDWRDLWADITA